MDATALSGDTTGDVKTATGAGALYNNTIGTRNAASGVNALPDNDTTSTGLTLFWPSHAERRLGKSGSTYPLPLLWGTITSTCSSEELPPLSVQVMVIV
jgi:hypothetical protein